ncbi:putative translation initiation factor eIF-1A [Dictyocaulus viviparus]|uniref:Probable RNA-binding protein EIF1AD n=1 Tax=Dictyocaulus viviparus TaxID=29172 RepID=A0A0D8Y6D3_DICVI|nr:putative translation initiation factor eIF-1A [Dictyocaulus viviparus]
MSISTKRRYITNKVESEYYTPVDGDIIAQVRNARGNNLHEVLDENGEMYVVSMPSKFRKTVWIRRGQFVVLRPIKEGDKVKAEIEYVLDEENVLYIRSRNRWPYRFEEEARMMTRDAKRGIKQHAIIDDDMLPPSDSDENEENEEDLDDEDDSSVNMSISDDKNSTEH